MSKHYTTMCLDIDGHAYIEDVECEVTIEAEVCHHEPYSWGQSRGTYVEYSATIEAVKVGNLRLNRDQADLMFGEAAMEAADEVATERAPEISEELAA